MSVFILRHFEVSYPKSFSFGSSFKRLDSFRDSHIRQVCSYIKNYSQNSQGKGTNLRSYLSSYFAKTLKAIMQNLKRMKHSRFLYYTNLKSS
ncbi:hypothetical protein [Helicobacter trogontum]|uniref:Uncharacterized protein n=1 Tax=Helicobacter trogontum TaxID=50960 RepID=A0A099VD07_9HELI|nr:hypothetical protein [Helicobacter trogontum]TLD81323.1 hypothetical protein LS81_008785 [Helicobacter trogontum]